MAVTKREDRKFKFETLQLHVCLLYTSVDEVAFSAGKRGFQMIVKAQDILAYLNVETGDIIRK